MIYYEIKGKKYPIDLSDRKWISRVYDLGRFEYECSDIDFENNEITIHLTSEKRDDIFGKFADVIDNCLYQACNNFNIHENITVDFHSKDCVPLSFLDEIHFVGIAFIEKINCVDNLEMEGNYYKVREKYSNNENKVIVDNYNNIRTKEQQRKSPLPIIGNEERNDTWWFDDEDEIKQSFSSKPTTIELMGCFVKEQHAIYICEENIKHMSELLKCRDEWFENSLVKFEELVVLHEIGHSVFKYIGFKESKEELILNETRANYFSSAATDGLLDDKIKLLTRFQPFIYRFPYLSFGYQLCATLSSGNYSKLLEEYYKMVGVLYGE